MIKSFGDKETQKIWRGHFSKRLLTDIQPKGRRKLRIINNAQDLEDLSVPPGNRLEKLKGELREFYSIRINDQWRIIFRWEGSDAFQVQIMDYH